jgi:hypothetical protein
MTAERDLLSSWRGWREPPAAPGWDLSGTWFPLRGVSAYVGKLECPRTWASWIVRVRGQRRSCCGCEECPAVGCVGGRGAKAAWVEPGDAG